MTNPPNTVLRETDADAVRLAKTLLRSARSGSLAVLDPRSGAPLASRVGVATDVDGTPLILISLLSAHTRALLADPRCSLLLGEPGKGDPLAHPRLSLACRAAGLAPGTQEHDRAERRYLNRNPKARLYAGLGDFSFFRLEVEAASLNGGFGKAYAPTRAELILDAAVVAEFGAAEQSALDHMNEDHLDAIQSYAQVFGRKTGGGWVLTGIDPDGIDLVAGDETCRLFFGEQLTQARQMHMALVDMARDARATAAG